MWGHLRTVRSARMSNSVQLAFYLFFMLYLIFTSLQMRHRWSARTACAFWGWSRPGRGTMSMWLLAALDSPTAWISSPVSHLRRRSGFSFQAQPAVSPCCFWITSQPADPRFTWRFPLWKRCGFWPTGPSPGAPKRFHRLTDETCASIAFDSCSWHFKGEQDVKVW